MPIGDAKTAARHLVEALAAHGADRVFCVPGESYLAVLDALADHEDAIQTVTCRHEGGAAIMAEADAKLTGRPGVCMVTRGPGATNASAGIHIAFQDSTPVILFIGQVARDMTEREGFQEIDYRRMFGQMAKWVAQIDDPARVHEFVSRAFSVATAGRPGPVVLALPEDMLTGTVTLPPPVRFTPVEAEASEAAAEQVGAALASARSPLVIVGGSPWDGDAVAAVQRFAERNNLSVAASFRRQDKFDNDNPCYVGELGLGANPTLRQRTREADLILCLGGRLGEIASDGYKMLAIPAPDQRLIHIHPDPEELGRVYRPEIAVVSTPRSFAKVLDRLPKLGDWDAQRAADRASYEAWRRPTKVPGRFNLGEALALLQDLLPEDAILTNGAGNFAAFLHRFHRYRRPGSQLAPTSGSMGYGVPAAVAAKLRASDRMAVCIAGDGDFMMTAQELATAHQYGAAPIFVVIDNGMLGTIRMHQERAYPARVSATNLVNPDFAALARSFGAHSEYVEETADFLPAFERCAAAGRSALIHVRIDPEALTPTQSLSQIRAAARTRV